MVPAQDSELIQIVNRSLAAAEAAARKADGSSWLACRPGCTPCCHGVFRISALDGERLRVALGDLSLVAPERAVAIGKRAVAFATEMFGSFPGDAHTGELHPEELGTWDAFADDPATDQPCPALDPATGRCELYAGRPLTCRVFGPPVMSDAGMGVCELCYVGASPPQVQAGEMVLHHHELEDELNAQLPPFETVIAWALLPNEYLAGSAQEWGSPLS